MFANWHWYIDSVAYLLQVHPIHEIPCVLSDALQVPLEVVTGATLKPKHGVFVKYEPRRSA